MHRHTHRHTCRHTNRCGAPAKQNTGVQSYCQTTASGQMLLQVVAVACVCMLSVLVTARLLHRTKPIYLIDFALHQPCSDLCKPSGARRQLRTGSCWRNWCAAHNSDLAWMRSQSLSTVPTELSCDKQAYRCAGLSIGKLGIAQHESEAAVFAAVRDALAKTGLLPHQIGVLLVTTSSARRHATSPLAACVPCAPALARCEVQQRKSSSAWMSAR